MRIAMMSAWNTDSGVAIHAEPIGRTWIEMGHELVVFSFIKDDFHGEGFTGEDEDFVIRCFGTDFGTKFFDPRPFFTTHYDIFAVQDLGVLPKENFAKIFNLIKNRASTVHIAHENTLPRDPAFYQFDWDAVVYFDKRQDFLKELYTHTSHIPFPCFPVRLKDKVEARKKLGLPLDKKIVLFFCQRGYSLYLPERNQELSEVLFLILGPKKMEVVEKFSPDPNIEIREEKVLRKERFDLYLFACDAMVLHKFQARYEAVVSSTAFQAVGSGCLLLVPGRSDFFQPFSKAVLRYVDREELRHNLMDVLKGEEKVEELKKAACQFAKKYSAHNIAKQYLALFAKLTSLKKQI